MIFLNFEIFFQWISTTTYQTIMKILSLLPAILVSVSLFSQEKLKIKFGEVSSSDFVLPTTNIIDSNTNAVIMADVGSSSFIGNKKGWFTLVFKRHTRIKILNDKAFDLATIHIPLYFKDDDEEKLVELKAFTHNLVNGKVISTKLEKSDLFQEKLDKNHLDNKFTMPSIRAGSIIEYTYTINSDFLFNMQPWAFQHVNYPCLWSEYETTIPNIVIYVAAMQGFLPFYVNETKTGHQNYLVTKPAGHGLADPEETLTVAATTNIRHFVMKDVPAFKVEDYLTSPRNYISKVEFQESKVTNDGETYRDVMNNWEQAAEELLKRDDFASFLHEDNSFFSSEVAALTQDLTDKLQKAKIIYDYVRVNFTCTSDEGFMMTSSLRDIVKKRRGNVADINLLLLALLNQAGIPCEPVLLSTRDHGINYFKYPILSKYNYVLCKVDIENKTYYLDATSPALGFGKLELKCYNGEARIINSSATSVQFSADSLLETKLTSVMISSNDKGEMVGSFQQVPGYFESYGIREKVREKGKDQFFKDVKGDYEQDVELINPRIDSLAALDRNVTIAYDFKLNEDKADVIYIDPMLGEAHKENLFKSAERSYPVEMPYTSDETYVFSMIIPEGYVVDELPKSVILKLNEAGDGQFEYIVSQNGGMISMRSRIRLKRAYFQPSEYDFLREFFNTVVKKHSEQIVLKKKK